MIVATFHKSDFVGNNLFQLIDILKQYATKGIGCYFINYKNFIQSCLPNESDYTWIMEHVANYGNLNINK